ncbi:protein ASI3 [Echria macrotheca]|uniref:Protein ASI3 n=1 Tax=Echria macrotheca TaxID=438768 RepID=A0AAJ0FA38_9PEZI|nr:protein ASI3 [Echria macrotheca]
MDDVLANAVLPPAPPVHFNNATVWQNLTAWTAQHLGLAVNMSRLTPSLEDLVWAGPRMVMKLGRLGSFISFPDAIDGFGQRIIPDPTGTDNIFHVTTPAGEGASFAQSIMAAAPTDSANQDPTAFVARFSMEGAKGLGSVFSYATSKWALSCIAMAIIFNRTHIFAATRRRLRLSWPVRLTLRLPLILLLLFQARGLLQSIQCQTSPEFGQLRWGNASKTSELMFSHNNPFLHGLSSSLLFGASDEDSCEAIRMIPWDEQEQPELVGSLSRLWPLFGTFCLSQFIEVVSSTVQGRPVSPETGMTLFEHSLAFAEADAAISSQLGWGLFANGSNASPAALGSTIAVTRSMILKRVNTPPEVLLVAFLSSMSYVTSHILGILNLQSRFRLVSTGFWGLCFMGSIVYSALTFSLDDSSAHGFLRYPTVCIIGFIPHILVLAGIMSCSAIYVMALVLSALAGPDIGADGQRLTMWQRLSIAHGNMQANVSLSDIRIRMDMDFYTALLRAGFGAITMASEAVYLNEDHRVNLKRYTWLEDERFREVEELRMQWIGGGIPGSRFDSVGAIGLVPIKEGQASASSGYAREKAAQKVSKSNASARRVRDGVGAAERSGRWIMAIEYIMFTGRLVLTTWALITLKLLSSIGIQNPPRWIHWLSQRPKAESSDEKMAPRRSRGWRVDWVPTATNETASFSVPRVDRIDVEAEMRRRFQRSGTPTRIDGPSVTEAELDSKLYSWWLAGGWWGNTDSSGDYAPPPPEHSDSNVDDSEFDTTSVISSTETAEDSWVSEPDDGDLDDLDDGQRTPTQHAPMGFSAALASARNSREPTPFVDTPMAPADLARLLHPQSPEDREEARTLAAHLTSDGIMTRSRFKRQQQQQRAQLLLATPGYRRGAPEKLTPDEEAQRLEQILLSRRAGNGHQHRHHAAQPSNGSDTSWATGAAGLGPDGPQCVVCQSAPRTIIVWPCRCLSLCDDCRVSLAMNNFEKCVCCRREVISFSRIYVP